MFTARRSYRVALTLALALMAVSGDAFITHDQPAVSQRRAAVLDGREVVDGEVIVRYRAGAGRIQRERAEAQADARVLAAIGRRGSVRLRSGKSTTREMLAALRGNPDVELVEPNYIIHAAALPNDSSFANLWGLFNNGQTVDGQVGLPGADINAANAWDVTTGSRSNIVAILDTGIDFNHPDLAGNVFTAPRRFSVTIGSVTITCDAGSHGFNALNLSCIPADDNGHGTHVAGIIGAVGNNNEGVTGVNWTASLMALKVLDANGTGTTTDAINAIDFAIKAKNTLGADGNVRVLNASWWGSTFSQALSDEIQAANTADMLFVAAAGAGGTNNDSSPFYPASAASDNVISVAALDNRDQLASTSNYGPTSVDLGAPGGSTLSTLPNNSYGYLSGTSMAAPFVSGAAALVLSVCPGNTAALKSTLLATVDPVSSLMGKTVTGGRVDVNAALQRCRTALHATLSGSTITGVVEGGVRNAKDWLAMYCPASGADSAYSDWKYLNGTQTAPASGVSAATVTFTAPSQLGVSCNLRLFADNRLDKIATSESVTTGGSSSAALTINDVSITEGNSGPATASFTVTLSPVNSSQTVTASYATANGTATTADNDYVAASGTVTFPPNVSTQTIAVTINGDVTVEPTETFTVNLSNAVNATVGDAQGVGTITNDDGAAGPSVTPQTSSVNPGGTITFTVAGGPGNPGDWVTLTPVGSGDSAYQRWSYLNGQQTQPSSGVTGASLQFVAPTTPGQYNIRLFANNSLQNRLATSNTITVAAQPTLSINDVTTTEGNSGSSTATFTVTLSPVSASQSVTATYATANGTATTTNNDYVAASGTVTFAPNVSTQTITVTINGDTTVESTETFTVNLSNAVNATVGDAQGVGTITNDDGPAGPSVTPQTSSVNPGGTINFTVSGGPGNPGDWVTLTLVGSGDSAYQQWSYLNSQQAQPSSGLTAASLQFVAPTAPGQYNIRLFANNSLQNKLATSNTITVATQPTLTINDVTITEGNGGSSTATFTVTLSPVNASQTVSASYATADGTATTANGDYVAANGTVTFAPNVSTQTIAVTINGDTTVEPTETFSVNLSNAVNATAGDAQGVGTITNDDAAAGPAVTAQTTSVSTSGTINFTVAGGPGNPGDWVTLTPVGSADSAYQQWSYLNGQHTPPGSGLTAASLQFVAPASGGQYNIRLFANNSLQNRLATSNTITVATQPTLSINDVTITEGNSGSVIATFTVTLSPVNPSQTVTVDYATANGSATAGSDYTAGSGTLSFAPSVATQTVTIAINGDTAVESNETFVVNLSNVTAALLGDAQGLGTIVSDDSSGPAVIVQNTTVTAGATINFDVLGGPGNTTDWVGFFAASDGDKSFQRWTYLDGQQTPPASGMTTASRQFTAPQTPGTYNIRFFANNGYTKLATGATITVTP